MSLLSRLRRDTARARSTQAQDAAVRDAHGLQQFLAALPEREPRDGVIIFARVPTPSGFVWAGRSAAELAGLHLTATGGSGTGKSTLANGTATQFVRAGFRLVWFDLKGEVTPILERAIPVIAPDVPVSVLRPFSVTPPPLRLTQRERAIPIQAQAESIMQDLVELLDDALSTPMRRTLVAAIQLAIELNEPLPVIVSWFDSPLTFARAARQSEDHELKSFAASLANGNGKASSTLQALAARLALLLHLPQTKAALSAETCIDFQDAFNTGATGIDASAPPGCEAAGRVLASLMLSRAIRAALSRPPESKPCVLYVDELQEFTRSSRHQRENFSRCLSLARFRAVSIITTFQNPAQLDAQLVHSLRTNSAIECCFRLDHQDATAYLHSLQLPPGASPTEARRELLKTLTTLPQRTYVCWPKFSGSGAVVVRSPRIDFDAHTAPRTNDLDPARHPSTPAPSTPAPAVAPVVAPLQLVPDIGTGDDDDDSSGLRLG